MIFKLKHKLLGGHVHVQFFSGKNLHSLALNGKIIFGEDEWPMFKTLLEIGNNEAINSSEWGHLLIIKDVDE